MVRNLLVHLRAHDEETLRGIADCWGVALTGRTSADHVAQLYRSMRDPWMVRDRVAALDPLDWTLIEALLGGNDAAGLTPDELAAECGQGPPTVAAALDRLRACGIVADDAERLALPRELATAFRRVQEERLLSPTMGPETPLRALLTTLEGAELEEAAEAWGIRVTPGTIGREALIDEILARVDLPEQRRAVARDLPPDAGRLLGAIREAGGRREYRALGAALDLTAPSLREAARQLNRHLLAWPVWAQADDDDDVPGRALIVPRDVLAPRRPPRDAPPPLEPIAALPAEQPSYPYSAAWDLLTVLQRLEQRRLDWRDGDEERNATALRRLAPALWAVADDGRARPGYLPFLLELARDAGLVRVEEERFEPIVSALDPWRGQSFAGQTRQLFTRWRAARDWPEAASQDDLQLANVEWQTARTAILDELRACQVGAWYDVGTLALRIARLRSGLLGGSFHAARASGPAGTREEVTAAAVEVVLLGALVPLGLLAAGTHTVGKRVAHAVRLTEVGAWLLGEQPEPQLPPIGDRPLTVGADFELLLFQPIPRRVWALGAIADLVRLDTASVYRLTEASVRRGIATGLSLDQIVTLLERGGRAPLPQNVAYTLREWTRDYAGVRLARALLLRPDDPTQGERLSATLARAGLPAPEVLPDGRLLLTLPADGEAAPALAALREAGFTPHWLR
jgi:Flp pilus assembly pilin Flp